MLPRSPFIGLFIGVFGAATLHAGTPSNPSASLEDCLNALARSAATFSMSAPGLKAEETLDQTARRGYIGILRGKKNQIKNLDIQLPSNFRTHHVISNYELAEAGSGHVLHEVRTIISLDGQTPAAQGARHTLSGGLRSPDDSTKHELLEDLEHEQLEGAVTDFGQLLLLFTQRHLGEYAFELATAQSLADEPAVVLRYRQIAGLQGLTFFKDHTAETLTAKGEIWMRQSDLLPLRITMNTVEVASKKYSFRTEATVDYTPSKLGLVPASVLYKQFLNTELLVENNLHYRGFHRDNAMIP